MARLRLASVALLLALAAPAHAVITVTSVAGAPDPGIPAGFTSVVTFDAPSAPGIVNTISGSVITAAGNISGIRAAPAGTPAGNIYQSVGTGGSSTFDFTNALPANQALTGFSLYWGSVDSYNFVDFIDNLGAVVATFSGSQLPRFDGNQTLATTNPRVTFMIDGADRINRIRLRSTGNAFEYDNFATDMGPLPEPANWVMLITGFGLIGSAMRRQRLVPQTAL